MSISVNHSSTEFIEVDNYFVDEQTTIFGVLKLNVA